MSKNLARRGGGSHNPNSNRSARQEKKNNNKKQLSDTGSDSDNASQKRSRIITKDSMDEDYEDFVADALADGGLVDFLAAAAPNSTPQTLEKLKNNKAIIEGVNNLFLETYESYTGRARMTGSGDAKRLIIHFHTVEARDLCVGSTHSDFLDLQFHLYDPKQLRSDEDLRAIQVTDIPFFITKPQLQSYFKKFGNLLSLHLYSRKGAKMQQARIVYDHADAISRFTTQ
ncbi:hypothetical protein RhiirB3_533061 [Rhizophagus irregularis]|nr:hypothetical protein RhiirB3_533061 [Rhizophagus irregularis]